MASLGKILARTFFWSYERGTWQYDLAVVVILIFVLLTPAKWFHDEPFVGPPPGVKQIELVAKSPKGDRETYRVDSRVLAPPGQVPALQNDLHNALKKASSELSNGRFSIVKIEPVRDDEGTVIAYQVEVQH